MPTYSYKCSDPNCAWEFGKLVKYQDRNSILCPNCGAIAIRQIKTNDTPAEIMEMGSAYHGVQVQRDLNKKLKERSDNHYAKHDAKEIRENFGHDGVSKTAHHEDGKGFKDK